MKEYIKGTYKRAIYTSNDYVIGLIKVEETNIEQMQNYIDRLLTFTGYFHELTLGDTYTFYGNQVIHPRYGFQYEVVEYEKVLPQDEDGIVMFLSSDLFKGIGEKQARSIVDILGLDALNKILEDKSSLYLVPKLTEKKINTIYETLNRYTESHETIVFLTSIGFTMRDSLSIYNTYKNNTKIKLEENIYDLIKSVDLITFNKVDEIALKLGIEKTDARRIKAGIVYVANNITYSTGNTYLEYEEIYDAICSYLNYEIEFDDFDVYLRELAEEKQLFKDEYKYYLYDIYMNEREIVKKIKKLLNNSKEKYKNIEDEINELGKINSITYNDLQKEAIISSLTNSISIITGGPGTGKTTIIKAITEIYQNINKITGTKVLEKIALLAPTGRASKRMSEATNLPASTIHRFLKWNKETNSFGVDEYNKNNHELIIVDEVSMIDINLLASLFKGITDNIKLILVGDANQLPSVGPGQILKDLIESKKIPTIELEYLYRQNENSYINTLANEIKNNELSDNYLKKHADYNFLECNSFNLKNSIKSLAQKLLEKGYNIKTTQFMAPMYKGECGIDNLNIVLQEVFNPKSEDKKEIEYGDVIYRVNDKVLQLTNMPEDNIFNGDIGFVVDILKPTEAESKKYELCVDYDGNIVKYTKDNFNKIKHGFIISIHKSQGSEFENVIIPVVKSYQRMLYKKLIYTGITRAKKKLFIVGEKEAFISSINNNNEQIRKTDLLTKLNKIK